MLFNTEAALASIDFVVKSIEKLSTDQSPDPFLNLDENTLLNSLQNIVIQGAALSKYFWPIRPNHEKRAELLRSSLGIKSDNLLKNRDLRNLIEHFDERLDIYFSREIAGRFVPQFVGTSHGNEDRRYHTFRAYYVDTGLFEMLGQKYEIKPICSEIIRIHNLLIFLESNGGRFRTESDHH